MLVCMSVVPITRVTYNLLTVCRPPRLFSLSVTRPQSESQRVALACGTPDMARDPGHGAGGPRTPRGTPDTSREDHGHGAGPRTPRGRVSELARRTFPPERHQVGPKLARPLPSPAGVCTVCQPCHSASRGARRD